MMMEFVTCNTNINLKLQKIGKNDNLYLKSIYK